MKHLLEVFLKYFDFLYLDPQYRIVDSSSSGSATTDAQLVVAGNILSWSLTNDRGQIVLATAPSSATAPENWFRLSIIRRFLDGTRASDAAVSVEAVDWLRANITRVESLFANPPTTKASCEALIALENSVADELFGPAKDR
ncbi:hypothetical protein [Mycolicibacterium diernhoferi]|uniref:Uncharacterized protein n=1 Tax=Mycolicibacterium diernhoferi TaxID=1801 RepID=A0A1Q4H7F6_9MYCO|nr:hypothetical protein [Mycolicibacterium diernhoferi]OJZ63476.1 hypothetical protein BRW64_21805 [Mycolicibacterium diernhoferi]OPE54463.1 hypothetical protein BV510_10130 [Mycolicibacterium diernhoferi]PEG55488.1 hypothetical protein CRI78_06135 [Mycolicibacterium diernhoferi]QYL24407.1 hypothetical protein K0O62_09185 [Mycolicibacterium diernhoferi]